MLSQLVYAINGNYFYLNSACILDVTIIQHDLNLKIYR